MVTPIAGAPAAVTAPTRPLPAAPRTAEAARKFQATVLTELMRPLFPHMAPLGALSSSSGNFTTEVVGYLFGEAISSKLAERDPFALAKLIQDSAARRHGQGT